MQTNTAKKSFRGWLILLCCVIMTFGFQGLISNQQGLFLEPVSSGLGLSRGLYSTLDAFTQTLNFLCNVFFVFIMGKFGIEKMVKFGAWGTVIYCFGMFAASKIISLAPVLIGISQACLGIFLGFTSVVPVTVILNNWFGKKRGLMISITQAGGSIGGTVFSSVVQKMIVTHGWEMAMVYRGIICAVVCIVICFVIKEKPGNNEVRVWEDQADDSDSNANTQATEKNGLTFKEALHTPKLWISALFFVLGTVIVNASLNCIPAFASDAGYLDHIGTIMTLLFLVSFASNILSGIFLERFGARLGMLPTVIALGVIGVLLSKPNPSVQAFYISAVMVGIAWIIWTVAVPMVAADLFGEKEFTKIQSIYFSACMVGAIVGYPIFNVLFDLSGSYATAYKASIVIVVIMLVILFAVTGKSSRKKEAVNK